MREIEDLILILLEFGILPTFQLSPWSTRGTSQHPAFMGNYYSKVFSLIHVVDKFFFKEVRTWVSPRFHLVVFVIGVNQEPQEAGEVQE